MEQLTLVDFDPRLQGPFSMIVAGPSGSGKTSLIKTLIDHTELLITPPVDRIVYHYGTWQAAYNNMRSGVEFHEGLPVAEDLAPTQNTSKPLGHTLCIVDDLMGENDKRVISELFTKASHHWMVSIIYITQNIYEQKCKYYRTMSLNTSYMVIFKNPRDMSQIDTLSRQVYPNRPNFLTAVYNTETNKPHSYIVIDFKQSTPDRFRVRSSITTPDRQLIFTMQ